MSREAAVDLLSSLRRHLNENWGLHSAQNIFQRYNHHGFLIFPAEWTNILENLLKGFLPLSESHYLTTIGGASKIDSSDVANAMVERLVLGVPPEQIIADWEHLLTNRNGAAISVTGLLGVQLTAPITLTPSIRLARAEDIPGSREREALFRIGRFGEPIFSFGVFEERWRFPSAAILVELTDYTLIRDGTLKADTSGFLYQLASIKEKVLAAITLSGSCAPVPSWSYEIAIHPALPYGNLGGAGGSGSLAPAPIRQGQVDADLLPTFYAALAELEQKDWVSLSLSIGRLARSRGHMSPADRAIDLGIAIETLLLHREGGPGAKSELRNKVGMRGAWLLGRTPEEREQVFLVLRKAYDARSQAVHNGTLSPKNIAVLEEADAICTQLLRTVVQMGAYPNWDKVVLGFDPAGGQESPSSD
jgi:hypothetical protein